MQEETSLVNSLIPPQVFNARSRQIARPPDHAMHHISLLQTKLRTILAGDHAIWFCGKRNFGVYTKVNLIHVPDHSSEPNMIRTVYCAKAFLGFLRMLPSLPVRHR